MDPRVRQSGPGPATHGHISKQGSVRARHALVEACWTAVRTVVVQGTVTQSTTGHAIPGANIVVQAGNLGKAQVARARQIELTEHHAARERRVATSEIVPEQAPPNERIDMQVDHVGAVVQLDRLSPYERGKVEQILFNIAYSQEKFEEARGHLKSAIDSGGLNAVEIDQARYQSAQLYMQEEKWREGAAALEEWFQSAQNPNSAAYYLLAVAYYQQDDFQRALIPRQFVKRGAGDRAALPRRAGRINPPSRKTR